CPRPNAVGTTIAGPSASPGSASSRSGPGPSAGPPRGARATWTCAPRRARRRAGDVGRSGAAVGRAPRPDDLFERIGGPGDLHPMLAEADVVLDALPLSPGTHHFFDAAAFAAMKPTARFLNVGRGATVDEAALVAALERGGIGGAALDVFEEEPLPASSPLWTLPTVIVSPHICGDFDGWERA